MADKEKKPNYLIWIMVGIGIFVLVFGMGFYLMWRKMSFLDIKAATTGKTVEDLRVTIVKLESEIKNKDEKLQDLSKEVGELRNTNTTVTYQLKEIKKNMKLQRTSFAGSQQARTQNSSKKQQQNCNDDSCLQDVEDLE